MLDGLKTFAVDELRALRGVTLLPGIEPEGVRFRFEGDAKRLHSLRTVVAVYRVANFAVPRPKALLGHQHLQRLLGLLHGVCEGGRFESFRFGAAGSGSKVFARLAETLVAETGLVFDESGGELLLRVKPSPSGWEVLARLTPKPLSARDWRVCNIAGGLNATVAVAMLELSGVLPTDRVLNAMCGSGTLLVERAMLGAAARLVGVDLSAEAIACARENLKCAGASTRVELIEADITSVSLGNSFDTVLADLPWGDAVGSHQENATLYPAFLQAAARLAASRARLVVLTHDIKLFESALNGCKDWRVSKVIRVAHSGHHPRMYRLDRM